MKRLTIIAALGAAALSSLLSANANATITDSLTGPSSGDVSLIQSALTSTPTDARGTANPNINSSSGKNWGNSRFGAGYNVSTWTGVMTSGYAEGYQGLTATATAFGESKTALQSYIYGFTNGPAQTANVYAYIYALGNLVRNVSRTGGDFNGTTYLTGLNQTLWNTGTQTFYIGPVPVSVGASVNANAGQYLWGHVWVDGIKANLGQSAGLTATAFGGIGPSWANAGIKVNNLSLINAGLNLNATAMLTPSNPWAAAPCSVNATVGADLTASLRELSGQLDLYASFLWFSDDYLLASWSGFYQGFRLFSYPATTQAYSVGCFPVPAAPQIGGIIVS